MKRIVFLGTLVLTFSLLAMTGNAADVFTDDFDSYTDTDNATTGLQSVWTWFDAQGITLETDGGASGDNYVRLPDGLGARREKTDCGGDPTDADPYVWSFNMRCQQAEQGDDYLEMLKWDAGQVVNVLRMGDGGLPADSDNFTANIWIRDIGGGQAFDSGWFKLGDVDETRGVNEWHNLKAIIRTSTVEFYIDDKYCDTKTIPVPLSFSHAYIGAYASGTGVQDVDDFVFDHYVEPTETPTEIPEDTPTPSSDVAEYEVYE